MLTSWADELVRSLPFPANQICTDDFTGPLANNTNLGAKGIIALRAFGELCTLTGAGELATAAGSLTNCSHYVETAEKYAAVWREFAYEAKPAPHYKMSYNPVKGVNNSW